jgi:Uncharacterised nucleotidyltransferase
LLAAPIDWGHVEALASEHGLRPALIELLSSLDWHSVPPTLRGQLEDFQRVHLLRMLEVADEVAHIARDFVASGLQFATFKGAVLSVQLYGHLAAREYHDIDVIVPEHQVDRAEGVLEKRGYRPMFRDRRFRRFFQGYQGQCEFQRPGSAAALDLHWSFSGSFVPFPLRVDDPWDRLTTVAIAGVDVPAMRPRELALLLAGHGTKEGWRSLMWVRDFAVLVAQHPDLDWADIHGEARSNGCGDSVLLACALAQRVLSTPAPPALEALICTTTRIDARAGAIADQLSQGRDAKRHFGDLGLCDRPRDRVKARLWLALTPTPGDFDAMPLPRPLWPAYYVTRPVRLASKAIRGTLPL